jgi:hypothetical protein
MTRTGRVAGWLCVAMLGSGGIAAQELFIFPQQGQDQAQQDQDRGACHVWAVNQTGFDPSLASTTPPPSQEARQGGLLRGGARGAALGAGGDAGRGAAMGAAGGGLIGGMRRSDQAMRQQQEARNWQAQQDAQRADFRRALTACLEGKGYTVR